MSSLPDLPLLDAISSLSREKESQDRFTAKISRDWCTQHSVLGGYLTALILSTARKYINVDVGDEAYEPSYPDPIHVFTQFLCMVPPGQVSISCKILRRTSRLCVVRVELDIDQGHHKPPPTPQGTSQESPACIAIATFADIRRENGLTQDLTASTNIHPPPHREIECVTIDDPVVDATPVTRKLHWVAPRSADGLWGHRLGGHQREVWLSFRDGSKMSDMLHLALLADLPLQPPATHAAGFYSRYALSTLCQTVEFKKRPDPKTEWVLVRSNSHRVAEGRFDVNLQILDKDGGILALSNHVVYISKLGKKLSRGARM